jgi:predicted metal-dependent phosphoesterase TrpH
VHTTASDGTLTSTEVIELAAAEGVRVISIADHDTMGGVAEALAAGARLGVEVVPAVELSIKNELEKDFVELHLLGYGVYHTDPAFVAVLDRVVQARVEQKVNQIEVLQRDGIDVPVEEVFALARGVPGRPHIARVVMVRNPGRFASKDALFREYLTAGGKAYVPRRFSLRLAEAVDLVVQAGGVPVLAHPGAYPEVSDQAAMVRRARDEAGIQGLEVAYTYDKNRPHYGASPQQVAALIAQFTDLADSLGLLKTGGSDFHGTGKDIVLGEQGLTVEEWARFKEQLSSSKSQCSSPTQR